MKKNNQNSWVFHLVCQKAFNKHTFVSLSVIYFLLMYNMMKHMPTDNKVQGQFKCDFTTEKDGTSGPKQTAKEAQHEL